MIPVIDGHNDVLLAAQYDDRDGGDFLGEADLPRDERGHVDLERCREGAFAAGLFAAFVPSGADEDSGEVETDGTAPALDPDVARAETFEMLARLHRWAHAADEFRLVRETDDLRACLDGDAVGAIPHVEGAAAVDPDGSNLDLLRAAGVRSIGLTWSRPNAFGRGVPFEHGASPDTGAGLTDAGRDLVRACEERGVLVDLAHLNEAGFWDVADLTDRPLVVSHAGAHAVSPATRNLTDEQLDAVAASDGLVGVTFAVGHLRPDGETVADTPLSVLLDHVDHVADRIGVDHVALGSDFDGATVPDDVGDVTGLDRVLEGLEARGYTRADRAAVAHGNWLRVFDDWWE